MCSFNCFLFSENRTNWIFLSNTANGTTSAVIENVFISTTALFTIHGSLTMHNCTIQTDIMKINLRGGPFPLSEIKEKGTDLQSCFDQHFVRLIKTTFLGRRYLYSTFQGNIQFLLYA